MENQKMDMIHGPLLRNMIIFALPVMASAVLEMLFNMADTIIVGKFSGQLALAAVGATGSLAFLMTSLFNGMSTGANVVIARYIGSQDEDGARKAVHTTAWVAIAAGIFMTVVGILAARPFLHLMSTPDDIIDLSTLYLRIYFGGSLAMYIYSFGSSILRSIGDTKRPYHYLAAAGVLNVALNLLFVIVMKWSVVGVASATVISQTLAACLIIRALLKERSVVQVIPEEIRPHREYLLDILRIGIPAGLQGMVFSISNIVIQSDINLLGSIVVAGNSAAVNIEDFVYIGMIAFSQASITFTSQNFGAGNYPNIRRILIISLILSTVSSYAIGWGCYHFGNTLLSLYTNEQGVIDAGLVRLQYVTYFLFLNGVLDCFVSSMRGMGRSFFPTLVMVAGICGIRLAYLFLWYPSHATLANLYLCFPISWTVTSAVQLILWIFTYRSVVRKQEDAETAEAEQPDPYKQRKTGY